MTLFAIFGLGGMEIAIIGVVAVLLFGNRLPGVAFSIGRSFIEFKNGIKGTEADVKKEIEDIKKEIND